MHGDVITRDPPIFRTRATIKWPLALFTTPTAGQYGPCSSTRLLGSVHPLIGLHRTRHIDTT